MNRSKVKGAFAARVPVCKCKIEYAPNASATSNNLSSVMRVGHILQNTRGGRPTHNFIGARVNYLGRLNGQSGGAGTAIKNRFI